jgi:hypothetical protein
VFSDLDKTDQNPNLLQSRSLLQYFDQYLLDSCGLDVMGSDRFHRYMPKLQLFFTVGEVSGAIVK